MPNPMAQVTYASNAEPSSRLNSTFHNMPPVDDNEDLVADEVLPDALFSMRSFFSEYLFNSNRSLKMLAQFSAT